MKNITYSFADDKDMVAIAALLNQYGLPFEDINEHIDHFIVAKESGVVIGSICIEYHGEYSLLRSLVVNDKFRNQGIAKELYDKIIEHSRNLKVSELYLLTTTAEAYFQKLGFVKSDRNNAPEKMKQTKEFLELCPSSAICMSKKIN